MMNFLELGDYIERAKQSAQGLQVLLVRLEACRNGQDACKGYTLTDAWMRMENPSFLIWYLNKVANIRGDSGDGDAVRKRLDYIESVLRLAVPKKQRLKKNQDERLAYKRLHCQAIRRAFTPTGYAKF